MKVDESSEIRRIKAPITWGIAHYLQRNNKKARQLMLQKKL